MAAALAAAIFLIVLIANLNFSLEQARPFVAESDPLSVM
jgi:hypothetical protein